MFYRYYTLSEFQFSIVKATKIFVLRKRSCDGTKNSSFKEMRMTDFFCVV